MTDLFKLWESWRQAGFYDAPFTGDDGPILRLDTEKVDEWLFPLIDGSYVVVSRDGYRRYEGTSSEMIEQVDEILNNAGMGLVVSVMNRKEEKRLGNKVVKGWTESRPHAVESLEETIDEVFSENEEIWDWSS